MGTQICMAASMIPSRLVLECRCSSKWKSRGKPALSPHSYLAPVHRRVGSPPHSAVLQTLRLRPTRLQADSLAKSYSPCPSRPGSRKDRRGGCTSGKWAASPARRTRPRSRRHDAPGCRPRRTWSTAPTAPCASPPVPPGLGLDLAPPPPGLSRSTPARWPAAPPRRTTPPQSCPCPWRRTPPCAAGRLARVAPSARTQKDQSW